MNAVHSKPKFHNSPHEDPSIQSDWSVIHLPESVGSIHETEQLVSPLFVQALVKFIEAPTVLHCSAMQQTQHSQNKLNKQRLTVLGRAHPTSAHQPITTSQPIRLIHITRTTRTRPTTHLRHITRRIHRRTTRLGRWRECATISTALRRTRIAYRPREELARLWIAACGIMT